MFKKIKQEIENVKIKNSIRETENSCIMRKIDYLEKIIDKHKEENDKKIDAICNYLKIDIYKEKYIEQSAYWRIFKEEDTINYKYVAKKLKK